MRLARLVGCSAALASTLGAQSGSVTLVGRVTTRDGSPLGQVTVVARTAAGVTLPPVQVNGDGTFRRGLPPNTPSVTLSIMSPRFQQFSTTIAIQAGVDEQRVPDIVLVPRAQVLPTVRSVAQRARPTRDDGVPAARPGERSFQVDPTQAVTGDLTGDPAWAMTALPGVQVTAAPDGGPPQISFGGVDASLNRTTMNGALAPATPPRDAAILQVVLDSYDPTVASSSLVTNWVLPSASAVPVRRLHATLVTPQTQVASATASDLGARPLAPIVSGNFAGPGKGFAKLVNASFQVGMQQTTVPTLFSANDRSLASLGLASDSVARLRTAVPALGLSDVGGRVARRSTQGSAYARIDLTRNAIVARLPNSEGTLSSLVGGGSTGDAAAIILGGGWRQGRGQGASVAALPLSAMSTDQAFGTVQGEWSHFTRWRALSTTRVALSASETRTTPASMLPAASVFIANDDTSAGGAAFASLGGSGASSFTQRDWLGHAMSKLRWKTTDNRHEFQIAAEVSGERLSANRAAGSGAFGFTSLENYLNDAPATFTRRIDGGANAATALRAAVAIGDVFQANRLFGVQYGLRVESERLATDGPRSPGIQSLFARDTRALPSWVAVSPMAGFTWALKRDARGFADYSRALRGGIRDYRGSLPLAALTLRPTSDAMSVLRCVGAAVPTPDWSAYAAGTLDAPTTCVDGSAATFAQRAPDADLFARDFTVGHSWRSNLAFDQRIVGRLGATLHGMLARNSAQMLFTDLNFAGTSRGALESEGMRPLFVDPASIVPATGAVATADSRRFASYGVVNERRSVGRSKLATLGATLSYPAAYSYYTSGVRFPFRADYTFAHGRTQANGFRGTTGDDPRTLEWTADGSSRHTFLLSGGVRIPDYVTTSLDLQIRSPVAFTPIVGSDINGDGLANDRAFLFDPRTAQASGVSGLSDLVADARPSTRRCLTSTIGAVARPSSCAGPWSTTMNAAVTIDSYRIGLQNRGSLRVVLSNVAAGLDLLLHGAANPRGWGQVAYPDPVLYHVRGYDAAANRFLYSANPRFGSSSAFRAVFANPFRIAIDVSIDVGRSAESRWMEPRLAPSSPDTTVSAEEIRSRLAWRGPALFDDMIRARDSLRLSQTQVDSLLAWSATHARYRDSVYADLATYLAEQRGEYTSRAVQSRSHDAFAAVRWHEWAYGQPMRALLDARQMAIVTSPSWPAGMRYWLLDRKEAARAAARWFLSPP